MAGFMQGFLLLDDQEINLSSSVTNDLPISSSRVEITPQADNDQITGLDKQFDLGTDFVGPLVLLINIHATRNLILKHNDSGSAAGNRIFMADGFDLIIPPFGTAILGWEANWFCVKTPYNIATLNSSGPIKITKRWVGLISPSTGNGYSVDISSAGFSNVVSVQATAVKDTATATSVPKVAVKTISTSAIVINIIEGNASLVSVLGFSVLQGASEQFANVTGLTVYLIVEGN